MCMSACELDTNNYKGPVSDFFSRQALQTLKFVRITFSNEISLHLLVQILYILLSKTSARRLKEREGELGNFKTLPYNFN